MQREVRSDANGTGQVAQPDRPASADAPPVLDRPADAPTRRCNCPAPQRADGPPDAPADVGAMQGVPALDAVDRTPTMR
jgi:hypothetical protein